LAGGASSRMGKNKSLLKYQGTEFWKLAAKACADLRIETFISCKLEQSLNYEIDYPQIHDKYDSIGPLGGLLSVFEQYSDDAWLVLPCDMPLIRCQDIEMLVNNRNTDCDATAIRTVNGNYEPLFSIWEPSSYRHLLEHFKKSNYSLKILLEQINVQEIKISDTSPFLLNINTPEDYKLLVNGK
jgi:molybdopterin-guanine dinucleotide biosynthesis protein A